MVNFEFEKKGECFATDLRPVFKKMRALTFGELGSGTLLTFMEIGSFLPRKNALSSSTTETLLYGYSFLIIKIIVFFFLKIKFLLFFILLKKPANFFNFPEF